MATELRHRPARRLLSATRATRQRGIPAWARLFTVIAAVGAALFAVQFGAFAATRIGVGIQIDGQDAQVTVDGNRQRIHLPATPTQVMFVPGSPLLREYQIDGTDDSNNFTEDVGYIERMVDQPYFGFQDWMRDSASYSSWRGITVRTSGGRQEVLAGGEHGTDSDRVELPTSSGAPTVVTAALMRLEIPAELLVVCGADPCAAITINRNDRYVRAVLLLPDGTSVGQSQAFFPVQALPFAAEIVYLLAHVALWSLALFVVLIALHALLSLAVTALKRHTLAIAAGSGVATGGWRVRSWWTRGFVWDRLAMATVALSFGFTCYIALVQYHAEPHILDASAYLMQAKIFASGHLSAPVPANLSAFQGPFMVAHDGRWFSQYAPGTSLLLAAAYCFTCRGSSNRCLARWRFGVFTGSDRRGTAA